jgi:hypothetical protein
MVDLWLEMEELLEFDVNTGAIKVDKSIFDDFIQNTYVDIVFVDKNPDEILRYIMVAEDTDGIDMELLV